MSVVAPIPGGSLAAAALRPALVVLFGAAGASGIGDGAVSSLVALLTGAALGVDSLGSTFALAGVAGAAATNGAISFGAALVAAGGFTAGTSICGGG